MLAGYVATQRGPEFDDRRSLRAGRSRVVSILPVPRVLAAQFGIAAWYHLGERRYFAWAPNDYVVTYDLQVMVGARSMMADEIASRYRLDLKERINEDARTHLGLDRSAHYTWEDPPQHLIDRIQGYELAYGQTDGARVTLLCLV